MLKYRAAACVLFVGLLLTACGFHLRGQGGSTMLPAELSTLRVFRANSGEHDALVLTVREALKQSGATVVATGDVPIVTLLEEAVESEVASVKTSTAKASEYRLRYTLTFRVDGSRSQPEQSIRLQREFSVDPAHILAKEQEEQELVRSMQQEAAQQLVRRLARGAVAR